MDYIYLGSNSSYAYDYYFRDLVIACKNTTNSSVFKNLTTSYAQQLDDASTLSASFIMFALTALFFILSLFSGLSDVSAILDPRVRVGLTSALTLFLPVMSYLLSEAKHNSGLDDPTAKTPELPQRARFILLWMLLIELLRKKVEEIHMQGYSGALERAGRVLWLGSLVFSNLQATGRKAMTGILWLLCASTLVQRIAYTEFGKRSLAFGKNARLITSYTAQVLREGGGADADDHDTADELLKRCKYAVMDEDKLVVEAIPSEYKLKQDRDAVATVGKIWQLAETDSLLASLDQDKRLRRLCLSFSLFKLLRRRFELLPTLTAAETRSYRQIIFSALHDHHTITEDAAFFDVTNHEVNFLCEYHHSVIPVVLASPFFLLANYVLFRLVVLVLCFILVVLCGNGNVPFALRSILRDNNFTFFGITQMTKCLPRVFKSPMVFFCVLDFTITFLLFLMFIYEEVKELFVFLLSDWFLVSLLCKYATNPNSRSLFGCSMRCILFMRSLMLRPPISFNQFSVLKFCGLTMPAQIPLINLPILVPSVAVPKQVKHSITGYLKKLYDRNGNATTATLSNGRSALESSGHADLLPFCKGDSVVEVILTWHIATSILEVEHPPPNNKSSNVVVATSLSKYCAYLVAFHPELLPENQDGVERVFNTMKVELYDLLGFWGYYFSPCRSNRYRKIKSCGKPKQEEAEAGTATLVAKGATLGSILARKAQEHSNDGAAVWNMLADLWVELLVYIAPSSDEERVAAHKYVLAKGGEFITVLWAMATHIGISRPTDDAVPNDHNP